MKFINKINIKDIFYPLLIVIIYLPFELIITYYSNVYSMDAIDYLKIFIVALLPYSFINMGRYVGRILLVFYTLCLIFLLLVIYKIGSLLEDQVKAIIGVSSDILLSILYSHIIALIIFFTFGVVVFKITRKLCSFKPLRAIIALLPLIIGMSISYHQVRKKLNQIIPEMRDFSGDVVARGMLLRWPNIAGIFVYGVSELTSAPISAASQAIKHDKIDKMISGKEDASLQNIILVIGESATAIRHHYLYLENTPPNTPYISQQIEAQNLCAIGNAFSTGVQTQTAVASMLSFFSPDHREKILTEQNIIELAHGAGYKTYWIDIQPGNSFYDILQAYISYYADITLRPDYRKSEIKTLLNEKTFPLNGNRGDEQLLPILEKVLSEDKTVQKKFIILHLHGSHSEYYNKYDQKDRKALPNATEYDLSIHHTDSVLEGVKEKADHYLGKNYIIFYSSDHGEDLKYHQHGIVRGNVSQYQIPVFLGGHADNHEILSHWCAKLNALRNDDGTYQQIMDKVILAEMMGYIFDPQALKRMQSTHRVYHVDGKIYDWGFVPDETHKGTPSLRRPELD